MLHIGYQIREICLAVERYIINSALDYDLEYLDGPQGIVLLHLMKHHNQEILQNDWTNIVCDCTSIIDHSQCGFNFSNARE